MSSFLCESNQCNSPETGEKEWRHIWMNFLWSPRGRFLFCHNTLQCCRDALWWQDVSDVLRSASHPARWVGHTGSLLPGLNLLKTYLLIGGSISKFTLCTERLTTTQELCWCSGTWWAAAVPHSHRTVGAHVFLETLTQHLPQLPTPGKDHKQHKG